MRGYRDLIVWNKAIELVVEIYAIAALLPADERYGLASQMKRASVSIPANIAEGTRRRTKPDVRRFLQIAFGSGAELETYFVLLQRLQFVEPSQYRHAESLLQEVMKMLRTMLRC